MGSGNEFVIEKFINKIYFLFSVVVLVVCLFVYSLGWTDRLKKPYLATRHVSSLPTETNL